MFDKGHRVLSGPSRGDTIRTALQQKVLSCTDGSNILIGAQVQDMQLFLLGQTFSERGWENSTATFTLYKNCVCVSLYKDIVRQTDISGHDDGKHVSFIFC